MNNSVRRTKHDGLPPRETEIHVHRFEHPLDPARRPVAAQAETLKTRLPERSCRLCQREWLLRNGLQKQLDFPVKRRGLGGGGRHLGRALRGLLSSGSGVSDLAGLGAGYYLG